MTIQIIPSTTVRVVGDGTIQSITFATRATATVALTMTVAAANCFALGSGGTGATGGGINNIHNLSATEGTIGDILWIGFGSSTAATGMASLDMAPLDGQVGAGTATGLWVLSEADHHLKLQNVGDGWIVLHAVGATFSTATSQL